MKNARSSSGLPSTGQTRMNWRESNNGPQRLREWITSHKSQARKLGLFSLEKRGFRGDLIYTSREGAKKIGNRLLSVVPKGWEAVGTKWNARNSIFTLRVIKYWNKLSREVEGVSSLGDTQNVWIWSWATSSRWICFQQSSSLAGWSQRHLPTCTGLWELWQHALILGQCTISTRIFFCKQYCSCFN